jgi:hypothetical protein
MLQIIAAVSAVALFLSLAGLAYYASSPPSDNPSQQQTSTQPEQKNQTRKEHTPRGFIRFMFPDAISIFTFWLVISTVLLALIAWIQIGSLNRSERIAIESAKAAKESAEATKATLIASEKAWIRIDEISVGGGGLSISEDGASVAIAFVVTNIGNSPAIRLSHHVKLIALATGISIPDEQAKVCDEAKRTWQGGFTLFPNDTFPRSLGMGEYAFGINISKDAIALGLQGSPDKRHLSLMVVGCIDYTFGTDPETHHQTPFIRQFRKQNITEGPISIDDKMIRAAALQLDEFGIGIGRAAD